MITAFATQPGQVAADGFGLRNSPFTTALLKHIATPGLEAGILFRRVAQDVSNATGGQQLPELSVSLLGEFYFVEQAAGLPSPAIAPSQGEVERAWAAIQGSTSQAVLEEFLRRYDVGIYGMLARDRLETLKKARVAVTAPPAQPAGPSSGAPEPAPQAQPALPALTKADVTKSFAAFASALDKIRSDYIEKPDETKLLRGAIAGMQKAFPEKISVAAQSPTLPSNDAKSGAATRVDVDAVYDTALQILNAQRAEGDDQRLLAAAIGGMTAELDPHSSYLAAKAFRDEQIRAGGQFGGLGIEVVLQDGQVKVVAPYDDSPAAKAGVMANDIITHLDDLPLQGLALNQAVEKMRGPEGSTVKLKIVRKGSDQPIEITITRARIQVRAVRARLEGDDIGFIRLTYFNEHATENLTKAIGDITTQAGDKLKGFIIDLRNNPGGLLNQAISVSDVFLEKGEIVSTRGRKAEDTKRFNAKPGDLAKGKPIVVLINGGSAAGSESSPARCRTTSAPPSSARARSAGARCSP